ncbi:hypothetical protein D3C73_1275270 [compost metagenome]
MVQRVVHGEEGARDGRRRLEGHALGNPRYRIGIGDQAIGEARRAEADNPVTRLEVALHLRTLAAHDTGEFEAQGRAGEAVLDGFVGQQAERVHDVAEVQAGGLDLDVQFIARRQQRCVGFPAQVAQLARQFEAEADLGRCLLLDTGIQLIRAHPQAGHVAIALGADGQFGFIIGIEQGW